MHLRRYNCFSKILIHLWRYNSLFKYFNASSKIQFIFQIFQCIFEGTIYFSKILIYLRRYDLLFKNFNASSKIQFTFRYLIFRYLRKAKICKNFNASSKIRFTFQIFQCIFEGTIYFSKILMHPHLWRYNLLFKNFNASASLKIQFIFQNF